MIALVNHGALLLMPQQQVKLVWAFFRLIGWKVQFNDVYGGWLQSWKCKSSGWAIYNRHLQQLQTLISPAVPSAWLLSCRRRRVPWGTCSFYEPLGLQLWSLCLNCCSVKSEPCDRTSQTLDFLRLDSRPVSIIHFLFHFLPDPPVVQHLKRTFKYFKDYRQVSRIAFPPFET